MSRHITLVPREQHPPRWVLVLIALAFIAAVAGLFRWLESKDTQQRVAGVPAKFDKGPQQQAQRPEGQQPETQQPETQPPEGQPPETQRPVAELKLLLETPVEELVGRQVVLEDVPVQQVVGDFTFWVGLDAQSRVPVVLRGELMQRQPESRVQVREGGRVRVFGVVRELRDVEAIDSPGYLSAREREDLRRAGLFISAQRVVPLGP